MALIDFHHVPMTKIWDRLYLGQYKDASGLISANPYDITAVLDFTGFDYAVPKGVERISIPFKDGKEVSPEKVRHIIMTIHNMIRDHRLLIHCAAGISRSPGMTAAYLYRVGFVDCLEVGYTYLQEKRDIVCVHPDITVGIKKGLKIWPYSDGAFE